MEVTRIKLSPVRVHGQPEDEGVYGRRMAQVYGQGYMAQIDFKGLVPDDDSHPPAVGSASLFVYVRCPEPDASRDRWEIEQVFVIEPAAEGGVKFTPLDEFGYTDFREAARQRIEQELERAGWPTGSDTAIHPFFSH